MAALDLSWRSFAHTHNELKKAELLERPSADGAVTQNLGALVAGLLWFKQPSTETSKMVEERQTVELKRGKLSIDTVRRKATAELSQLLNLDAVQTHLLLRRALPRSSSGPPPSPQLSAEETQQVIDLYFNERAHLLKCQQMVLRLEALDSPGLNELLQQLVSQGVEKQLAQALSDNLAAWADPNSSSGSSTDANVLAAGTSTSTSCLPWTSSGAAMSLQAVHVPAGFQEQVQLQVLRERAELLLILTQLYHVPVNAVLGSSSSSAGGQQGEGMGGSPAGGNNQSSGSSQATELVQCGADRLLELTIKLGEGMFRAPALEWGGNTAAAQHYQLCEVLGAGLVIAGLRPMYTLQNIAASAASGKDLRPRIAGRLRLMDNELRSWSPRGSTAAVRLVFAAWLLMHEVAGQDAQSHVLAALRTGGGYAAITQLLQLEELDPVSPEGQLLRDVLLQGLGLVGLAYEFNPFRLPEQGLRDLLDLVAALLEGQHRLVELMWDPDQPIVQGFQQLCEQCCQLFPAFSGPLLQLLLPLSQGAGAAGACYELLEQRVKLTALYPAGDPQLHRALNGEQVVARQQLVWQLAPDVQGVTIPEGTFGRLLPLPLCCQPAPADPEGDGPLIAEEPPLLVQWDVEADDGLGQVVLLARAAHCLRLCSGLPGQQLLRSSAWQELGQVLQLLQQMLSGDARLAQQLLGVKCLYSNGQYMDWLDVTVATLNLVSSLVSAAGAAGPGSIGVKMSTQPRTNGQARSRRGGGSGGGGRPSIPVTGSLEQLHQVVADCLRLVAEMGQVQPHRVMLAVGGSALLQGVQLVDHMPRVAVEELPAVPQQQLAACLELQLPVLELLQTHWEAGTGRYPVTRAVLHLTTTLLSQHYVTGPMSSLVMFCMLRVLSALGWLPFNSDAERWELTAAALQVVRAALDAGAVAAAGASPKQAGPPVGLQVTALAAACVHQLANSGPACFAAALPLAAPQMEDLVTRVTGSTRDILAAGTLVDGLLELVPALLALCAHFPVVLPLQRYWLASVPPNGSSTCPAALLVGYCTYRYGPSLNLAAMRLLHSLIEAGACAAMVAAGTPAAGPGSAGRLPGPFNPTIGHSWAGGAQSHTVSSPGTGCVPPGWWCTLAQQLPGAEEQPSRFSATLLAYFRYDAVLAMPGAFMVATGLLEAAVRHCPELADQLCFPDRGTSAAAAAAAADAAAPAPLALPAPGSSGTADPPASAASAEAGGPGRSKGAKEKPFTALDGLWQLLKGVGQLLKEKPQQVAAALRVLCALWETQETAAGAVDALREQTGFWDALKACLPTAAEVSAAAPASDAALMEVVTWRLQAQASCLQLLLLELITRGLDPQSPSSSPRQLLSLLGAAPLLELMAAGAALQLHLPVLQRFLDFLQATCLQLCSSTVAGSFASSIPSDLVSCAPELRVEVQPFWAACTQEGLGVNALEVACHLLVHGQAPVNGGIDFDLDLDQSVAAGHRVVARLRAQPLGATLLSYAAVGPAASSFLPGECGRSFLLSAPRLTALLGAAVCSEVTTVGALQVLLEDVSLLASYCQGRLALQQAAALLYGWVARDAEGQQQLTQEATTLKLMRLAVQVMDTRLAEHQLYKVSPVSCAAALPWALPFFANLSNAGLEVAAHQLLNVVRIQRAAASAAAAAGSQRLRTLPAGDLAGVSSNQQGGDALQQLLEAATSCARLFTAWLTSEQVNSMPLTSQAVDMDLDTPAVASLRQEAVAEVDVLECLATSLLQLLQLVTTKAAQGAGAAATGRAAVGSPLRTTAGKTGGWSNADAASGKLALATALEQLLPLLCVLAARSSSALSSAEAAAAHDELVAARQQVQGLAAVAQLVICICQQHLPASTWVPVVRSHLQLVMLVNHMTVRVAGRMQAAAAAASSPPDATQPMLLGGGSLAAAGAAPAAATGSSPELQQAAVVLDASILELATVAAGSADAALELCHQGLVGVLVCLAQVLQDPSSGGLLAAAAVTAPGGSSAAGSLDATEGGGDQVQAAAALALWVPNTLGAYCWPSKASRAADTAAAAAAAVAAKAASPRRRSGAGGAPGSAAAAAVGRVQQQLVRSQWNPVHQQWCQWLSLASLLLQQLRGQAAAEEVAMDLFSACQARLQLSLAALQALQASSRASGMAAAGVPQEAWLSLLRGGDMGVGLAARRKEGGGQQQQLGLGLLVEVERGLQLLCGVAGYSGAWQLVAPGSLASFRAAMTGVLQFGALPSGSAPLTACSPLSPLEQRLIHTPAAAALPPRPPPHSWLSMLARLAAVQGELFKPPGTTAGVSPGAAAAAGAGALVPAGSDSSSSSGVHPLSEYGLRVVEAVHLVLHQALLFSLLTSPQVEERELALARSSSAGGGSTTTWPDRRLLETVQRQSLELAVHLLGASEDVPTARAALPPRQLRLAALSSQVARLCAPLINAWGEPAPGGSTSSSTAGGSSSMGYSGGWQQLEGAARVQQLVEEVDRLLGAASRRDK